MTGKQTIATIIGLLLIYAIGVRYILAKHRSSDDETPGLAFAAKMCTEHGVFVYKNHTFECSEIVGIAEGDSDDNR